MLPVPEYPLPKELFGVLIHGLSRYPGISYKGEQWLNFLRLLSEIRDIQEENYLIILKLLLYLEEYYNNKSMEQYNLRNQKIQRSVYSPGQFVISVPGLAEDRPSLLPNDIVEVHEIKNKKKYNLVVNFVGQDYITVRPQSK